jgi:putative spermidine/putrescine transport system ATP-binding protein
LSTIVHFENISKTYDGRSRVVKDLNLKIERGEFFTFLGPSGSGKTTSLMMLAGFEAPTAGEIYLDGRGLSALPPYRRDIGMVFQNYALFPHMTVGENVAFPLRIRKVSKSDIARRVADALDMVQLPSLGGRRPNELSGGQQQRVALARALVFAPKLILLDEPLGALDRQLREDMQIELRSLHARLGLTLMYVTHDQGEALTMSSRIAVFRNGVVEQVATPVELYQRSRNAFVARFVGDNNLVAGVITDRHDGRCKVEVPGVGSISCTVGESVGNFTDVVFSIRPENIRISRPLGTADENAMGATLVEHVFLGEQQKLTFRLADGQTISVKAPVDPENNAYVVGDRLKLYWRPDNCMAFAPE